MDLLADRLAEIVGLGRREAGELLRDLHVLLLVDADAVRGAGDRPEPLVGERHLLLARLAPRVDRDVAHRPRPVERHERDQVLELGRPHLAERVPHAGRLELEDTGRLAARQHGVGLLVVERHGADREVPPPGSDPLMSARHSSITSRLRRPRKSILSRPSDSTSCIANWVTTSWSTPFCWSGTTSTRGRSAITTPAAWIESWRTSPSSGVARSTICRTISSAS